MMYLLWGLLNIGLSIFFIITCFRAVSLVNEKVGFFTSVIFALGLSSFVCNPKNDRDENKEPNSYRFKTWKFAPEDSFKNKMKYIDIKLEKKLTITYILGINYAKDEEGKITIPVSASSWTNGYPMGTQWRPSNIYVRLSDDSNRLEYEVHGMVDWHLLGGTLSSQSKEYKGSVKVE